MYMRKYSDKAFWYWNRLRTMTPGEVAHRVDEKFKKAAGRFIQNHARFELGDGGLPEIPGIRAELEEIDKELLEKWAELSKAAKANSFTYLGLNWPSGIEGQKWHLDPVTQNAWPKDRYCFDID